MFLNSVKFNYSLNEFSPVDDEDILAMLTPYLNDVDLLWNAINGMRFDAWIVCNLYNNLGNDTEYSSVSKNSLIEEYLCKPCGTDPVQTPLGLTVLTDSIHHRRLLAQSLDNHFPGFAESIVFFDSSFMNKYDVASEICLLKQLQRIPGCAVVAVIPEHSIGMDIKSQFNDGIISVDYKTINETSVIEWLVEMAINSAFGKHEYYRLCTSFNSLSKPDDIVNDF